MRVSNKVKRKGNYKRISKNKLNELSQLVNSSRVLTLNSLADILRVRRATIIKYIVELNRLGRIPDNNPLVKRIKVESLKRTRPYLLRKLVSRRKRMVVFINNCRLKKIPVSVNMLQQKFGGEKKFVKIVLDSIEKEYSKSDNPLIRRTKSDQPKRSKL